MPQLPVKSIPVGYIQLTNNDNEPFNVNSSRIEYYGESASVGSYGSCSGKSFYCKESMNEVSAKIQQAWEALNG